MLMSYGKLKVSVAVNAWFSSSKCSYKAVLLMLCWVA